MDKMFLYMMAVMIALLFPGFAIINSLADQTLANPLVSGTLAEPIVRLIPIVYVVGDIIGILSLMARWVTGNR